MSCMMTQHANTGMHVLVHTSLNLMSHMFEKPVKVMLKTASFYQLYQHAFGIMPASHYSKCSNFLHRSQTSICNCSILTIKLKEILNFVILYLCITCHYVISVFAFWVITDKSYKQNSHNLVIIIPYRQNILYIHTSITSDWEFITPAQLFASGWAVWHRRMFP